MIKTTTFVSVSKVSSSNLLLYFFLIIFLTSNVLAQSNSITYFEDFNDVGYPTNLPNGAYWTYHNEIYPSQDAWNKFIPGDGNAYLTVDADINNDTDWIHPFQTLEFGGVGENHRLEVRMKGAVVDGGLVGFLFTYNQEGSIFNEVDIEVVANDSATPNHETLPENGGWTDARFNTWRNANERNNKPFTGTKKPVVNNLNEKISLIDDQFHTYTIDWREDKIDFFIDGILQETITTNVATGWSEVIIGFRQLPWAGNFNWSGTHTMIIDYLKIEPLEKVLFATDDSFTIVEDITTNLDVLINDSSNTTIISFDAFTTQGFPVSNNSNVLTYNPSRGFIGQDNFTYTIEDTNGSQKTATVNLTVEKYIPPLDAANDAITVVPNSFDNIIDITANDSYGPNGENPTHPITLPGGKIVTATNIGGAISVVNGKINYSPPSGFTGIDTFQYTITDGNGFADTAIVTITIGGSLPANAVDDTFSVNVDTASQLDVLANDSAGTTIITFDTNSTQGFTVSANSSLITYTPANGFVGQDNFSYTIQDTNGNQSTANVTINVKEEIVASEPLNAVNDAVIIDPNSVNIPIDVTNNDSFGENGESTTHPLTLTNGKMSTASTNGGAIAVVNGKINYSTPSGFTGIDTFQYTITDGNGFADTAIVTITVGGSLPANAVDDTFSVNVDTASQLDVLTNDSAGTTITDFDTNSTQGFTVSANSSLITYTPAYGFVGQDNFSYTIQDTNGNQSTANVTINVKEEIVASGPLNAVNDAVIIDPNSVNIPIDVTNNDSFGENGESATHPLTLTNGKMSTASTNGGAIAVVNGKINYSTPSGFTGIDTFQYTITDGNGFADTAIVTITVGDNASKTSSFGALKTNEFSVLENSYIVHPNPSEGYLKNTLLSSVKTVAKLVLYNVTGKVVYSSPIEIKIGKNEFDLNLNLKPGIVFMKITSLEMNFGTKKLIFK
ncbi:Ig-like domain-containing protein [Polaribacter porphyrae]|uniref:GH16 domain-containing protein n=1 Tax=Polaribacter porphyrae TaxID=1137780 RepID=A0A2S7WS59_9FLAO|nr:Ig-like domain-containing protein [Polaribacter porphyrae]PQJ80430.1 hypothetical protein BTO18_15175 [Polaribacter porphyrae]